MTDTKDTRPITYKLAGWYAYGFSGVFLLYGGVKIILSILDRNYDDLPAPIIFLVVGMILFAFAKGYEQHKKWGWYGQVVINGLVVIGAAVTITNYLNIVLLVLSAAALYFLFADTTKEYLFGPR